MSINQKKEDSLESSLSCCVLKELKTALWKSRLLSGRCRACRGSSRRLWHAQVARSRRLGDLVDHQFERRAGPSGVEEDRLVNGAIFLFKAVVIRQHVNRVAIFLRVGVLQLDLDGADFRGAALALHGKFEVIALPHAAE